MSMEREKMTELGRDEFGEVRACIDDGSNLVVLGVDEDGTRHSVVLTPEMVDRLRALLASPPSPTQGSSEHLHPVVLMDARQPSPLKPERLISAPPAPAASSTPQGEAPRLDALDHERLRREGQALGREITERIKKAATPPPATGLAPGLLRAAEIVREREREWFGAPGKTIEAVQYAATTAVFVDDIARALRAEAQAASGDATGGGEK